MDQPGKVASAARGQLNSENELCPVAARAREFGLARRVRPSRPALACSFSILRLNLVVNYKSVALMFLKTIGMLRRSKCVQIFL